VKAGLVRSALNFLIICAASLFFLAGCAVGPNYHRPDVATAPAWKEQPPWRAADPKDSIPKGNWWATFTDSELDQYEAQALKSNQTIEVARYQLEQARASARITRSGLFPQLAAGISAQRSQTSAGRPTTTGIRLTSPSLSNDFLIPFNLTWEPDVFGGVRRNLESANATYQASAAALENVRLVITSELAVDYFSLRELDAEIAVVNASVEYQNKSLTLVQNRHTGGIASGLDVAQQETLLNSTRTQATLLRRQRAQFEHAIAALVGVPASSFSVPVKPLELAPPPIPIGVPSDILERRPDVAQSERQMAAQNAQIGVAKSAYFPGINLSAGGGFENTALGSIIGASTGFWALGANVAQTVLSGGRRRAAQPRAVARQPGLRTPGPRPALGGGRESVLNGLLGEIEVPEEADQRRQDPAPLIAEDLIEQRQRSTTGRTSTAPSSRAAGIRAASWIASSRSPASNT